jgi:hypothetical protein
VDGCVARIAAKRVVAVAAGEQAESEQQGHRAEAGHQQINVAGADVLRFFVMRHHQRPGGERHELPGDQKAEGIVSQYDEVHCG